MLFKYYDQYLKKVFKYYFKNQYLNTWEEYLVFRIFKYFDDLI